MTIDEKFKEIMQSNTGCAVVMAGSDTDKSHIEKVVESLKAYGIPHEVRICSAHKQPRALIEIIEEYNKVGGSIAYVAIAGGTDALSGTASFHTLGPVISCPPDTRLADKEKYIDNINESCLKNPPGSCNAYIGRPENVGKFIAQMYAGVNPQFATKLKDKNKSKIKKLEEADKKFRKEYRVV